MRLYKLKNRGQAIVLVAIALLVLLLLAGLAIDGGIAYGVKAKLSSAVDSAALAAASALNCGSAASCTDDDRRDSAITAGTKFFNANFPSGYLWATPTFSFQRANIVRNSDGSWDITVNATATVPTFLLRITGNNTFTAAAVAVTHKRDLDMVLVMDNTGSIADNPADPQRLKNAAVNFVNRFDSSSDRLALIRFAFGAQIMDCIRNGDTAPIHCPPGTSGLGITGRGFDKTSVVNHINSMTFNGNTNFSEAFWRARDQLDSIPLASRSSFRVIVFFSDGSPNSFSSTFSPGAHTGVIVTGDSPGSPSGLDQIGNVAGISAGFPASSVTPLPDYFNLGPGIGDNQFGVVHKTLNLSSYRSVSSSVNFDNVNNAARNLPEDMANDARASGGIYIFTLGLGQLLTQNKSWGNHERGDTILRNMANDPSANTYSETQSPPNPQPTGLYCLATDSSQLDSCFQAVANQILRLTK